jgi:hypothetical protein
MVLFYFYCVYRSHPDAVVNSFNLFHLPCKRQEMLISEFVVFPFGALNINRYI